MSLYPVREGVVESCRPREHGVILGVRTAPFLVEHYHHDVALKIGEKVHIHQRDNHYTITQILTSTSE